MIEEIKRWMLSRGVSVESDKMIPEVLRYEYDLEESDDDRDRGDYGFFGGEDERSTD